MAVKRVIDPQELQCLSSDTKPMAPDGSTLHIVTTGECYVAHDGAWEIDRRLIYAISQIQR